MRITKCRSCNASVLWCRTGRGERMPLDAIPVRDGNLMIEDSEATGLPLAVVIDLLTPAGRGTRRYVSHFVTCPQAGEWRR